MEQQQITRDLEYYFTDEEKLDMGKQLAAETQGKRKLEDSKKAVVSQYSSQINEKQEIINQLTDKIAAGYEFRKIGCTVKWHTPERNKKTIIREDTGAEMVERMTEYDHDLFNQWEEKQAELAEGDEHEFEQEINIEGEEAPQTDAPAETGEETPEMTEEELAYEQEKLLAEAEPEAPEEPEETLFPN